LFAALIAIFVSTTAASGAAPDGQEEICTSPAVILCDNFEARALGSGDLGRAIYKNPGWAMSELTNMIVATTDKFDGTKSLEFRYPAGSGGVGYMGVALPGLTDLYMRHYVKWSTNWTFSPIATKHIAMLTDTARVPWVLHSTWGSPVLHHIYEPTQTPYDQNIGVPMAFVNDQWYCMEIHLKMNPGASNDILEGWVDGVKKFDYSTATLDGAGSSWVSLMLSGYWNEPGTHAAMSRWFDNIVVSTQRIGCIGGSPRPATPTGLTVR